MPPELDTFGAMRAKLLTPDAPTLVCASSTTCRLSKLLDKLAVVVSTSSAPPAVTSTVSPIAPMVNCAGTSVVWFSDTCTSLRVSVLKFAASTEMT